MSKDMLVMQLRCEARRHRKCGANDLGLLFESAANRILELEEMSDVDNAVFMDAKAMEDEILEDEINLLSKRIAYKQILKDQLLCSSLN